MVDPRHIWPCALDIGRRLVEPVLLSAAEFRTSDHGNNWPHRDWTSLGWEVPPVHTVPEQAMAEVVEEEEEAAAPRS